MKPMLANLFVVLLVLITQLLAGSSCWADKDTNGSSAGANIAEISNGYVRVSYDLSRGEYCITNNKEPSSRITRASVRVNDLTSSALGLTHLWKIKRVKDRLGRGKTLSITISGDNRPSIMLDMTLYDNSGFVVLNAGVHNTSAEAMRIKEIAPLTGAHAFAGIGPKQELKMLDGNSNIFDTKVTPGPNLECCNNLLVSFMHSGKRKSLVMGGLTYHEYAKYFSAKELPDRYDVIIEAKCSDPYGKLVDPHSRYMPDDKFYIDITSSDPFKALESYGLCLRAAMNAKPNIYNFPTMDGYYMRNYGGSPKDRTTTAGLVAEMDCAKSSGFTRYSRVAVRLIPDTYDPRAHGIALADLPPQPVEDQHLSFDGNTEQGWYDDEHYQKYGHYVAPYETTEKWAKAAIERGGIVLHYNQGGFVSDDYARAYPGQMLFNDVSGLEKGWRFADPIVSFDTTDADFQTHILGVYTKFRDVGVKGLFVDYPGALWHPGGGFDDKYATTASAYRKAFELYRKGLGQFAYINENAMWTHCLDMSIGLIDSQRVVPDSDFAWPDLYRLLALRWYKNRVIWSWDTDSKNLNKAHLLAADERDGRRQMLTMLSLYAPRLILATSFSMMTREQMHDLSRIYPVYLTPKSARPLDAFAKEYPQVFDFEANGKWHQVAFYNPDAGVSLGGHDTKRPNYSNQDARVGVDMSTDSALGGLGLNPCKSYYVYDFWNDKFVGKMPGSGRLEQMVRPGEVRMMSVHEVESNPQFISTNRHIMQGYVDLRNVAWDSLSRELRGRSDVIGGETYKVVIASNGWFPKRCIAAGATCSMKSLDNASGLIVLSIDTARNRSIDWTIVFSNR